MIVIVSALHTLPTLDLTALHILSTTMMMSLEQIYFNRITYFWRMAYYIQCRNNELENELLATREHIERLVNNVIPHFWRLQTYLDRLLISQTAQYFEEALCKHILPEIYTENRSPGYHTQFSLYGLLKVLNGDQPLCISAHWQQMNPNDNRLSEQVLQEAKRKWESLCNAFQVNQHQQQRLINLDHNILDPNRCDMNRVIYFLKRDREP